MLRRKITSQLENWYKTSPQTALCIFGARQVGKTTVAQAFARQNFQKMVELNFLLEPELRGFLKQQNPVRSCWSEYPCSKILPSFPAIRCFFWMKSRNVPLPGRLSRDWFWTGLCGSSKPDPFWVSASPKSSHILSGTKNI
jgi:hypothetical protein